jgi:hypothetical protein
MCISIGTDSDTCAPASAAAFHASSVIPVMWMKMLSGPKTPFFASSSKVGVMPKVVTTCSAICRSSSRPISHISS